MLTGTLPGHADDALGWPTELPAPMTPEAADAARAGLAHLARMQESDGHWGSESGGGYPVTMTSLAILAFLASGSTPEEGAYANTVTRGVEYLLQLSENGTTGYLHDAARGSEARGSYGHGYALLCLAQCCGMELEPHLEARIRVALRRGAVFAAGAQSHQGGWHYTPSARMDSENSVTVALLQGLRACHNVGTHVPGGAIQRANRFLLLMQMEEGGIGYQLSREPDGTERPKGMRPVISVAALAALYSLGTYGTAMGGSGPQVEQVDRLVAYVDKVIDGHASGAGGYPHYLNLYAAQVRYQHGGDAWTRYYRRIATQIVKSRTPAGSLSVGDLAVGREAGSTFSTAISAIILQLPLGYLPIAQH